MAREYMFGCGSGHLGDDVAEAAESLGADLVNYTDPGCSCGAAHGNGCPLRRRHWFTVPEFGRGEFVARSVLQSLRALDLLPEGE